jgi:hypothetical protein
MGICSEGEYVMSFRRAMVKTGVRGLKEEKMTLREFARMLRVLWRHADELEAQVVATAVAMGKLPPESTAGDIDWDSLLDLLMQLLPLIIELIMLFFV